MSPTARDREMANHLKQVAWEIGIANDGRDAADEIAAALAQARAEEREACAKVAEGYDERVIEMNYSGTTATVLIAAAIRARSEEGK